MLEADVQREMFYYSSHLFPLSMYDSNYEEGESCFDAWHVGMRLVCRLLVCAGCLVMSNIQAANKICYQ